MLKLKIKIYDTKDKRYLKDDEVKNAIEFGQTTPTNWSYVELDGRYKLSVCFEGTEERPKTE